eukprot:8620656-Lingulodinium_polyedra.AAC.1
MPMLMMLPLPLVLVPKSGERPLGARAQRSSAPPPFQGGSRARAGAREAPKGGRWHAQASG